MVEGRPVAVGVLIIDHFFDRRLGNEQSDTNALSYQLRDLAALVRQFVNSDLSRKTVSWPTLSREATILKFLLISDSIYQILQTQTRVHINE